MTEATPHPEDELLREFLRARDVKCPKCRYNLRDLQATACPECNELLVMSVDSPYQGIGWLIAAITPVSGGFFCAMIFMLVSWRTSPLALLAVGPLFIMLIELSILVVACLMGRSFTRLPVEQQIMYAGLSWIVHVAVVGALILAM